MLISRKEKSYYEKNLTSHKPEGLETNMRGANNSMSIHIDLCMIDLRRLKGWGFPASYERDACLDSRFPVDTMLEES